MMKEKTVNIPISAEARRKVEQLARLQNRSQKEIITEAIQNYLEVNDWQIQETERALERADSSEARWDDHQDIKVRWNSKLAD